MPEKMRQHFVPQHYLRQFRIDESEQIAIAMVAPFKFIGAGPIKGQCQENYFYGKNDSLDDFLTECEKLIAPVLVTVCNNKSLDDKELGILQTMAVILRQRTRKAAEARKITHKYIVAQVIKSAIQRGELPPCPDGEVTEDMWDFKGVPGLLIKSVPQCLMEMQTLGCKMLESPAGCHFITSDNPVVILNQFCVGADPNLGFVGFSKAGFQLLLPISPTLCLFFYDEQVYKVGNRRDRLVEISMQDVEIVNALQVQASENCLYFHSLKLDHEVRQLVSRYAGLRVANRDLLQVIPMNDEKKKILHTRAPSVKLPQAWSFCLLRKHIKAQPGDMRKPEWTALGEEFLSELEQNPNDADILARLKQFHEKFRSHSPRSNGAAAS